MPFKSIKGANSTRTKTMHDCIRDQQKKKNSKTSSSRSSRSSKSEKSSRNGNRMEKPNDNMPLLYSIWMIEKSM
tara:strand:- start:367 stop:588 length:222 start_codon:yes stop_codon:yes gene_type:complete